VLAGDADGRNPASSPVTVTVGIVGLAGSAVMVGPVNLDDRGAAVAEHDEIGGAHSGVSQLRPRQRQHGDRLPERALPLDFREDFIDGQLGATAEYQAVLRGLAAFRMLAPRLVGRLLLVELSHLVPPVR
jgi:hypothetical protein